MYPPDDRTRPCRPGDDDDDDDDDSDSDDDSNRDSDDENENGESNIATSSCPPHATIIHSTLNTWHFYTLL